jgi:hypothetical protein
MCTAIALALIAEKALGQYAPKPGVE